MFQKKREDGSGLYIFRREGCNTQYRTKTVLSQHEQMHEKKTPTMNFNRCHKMFARQCNLANHAKYCNGMGINTCQLEEPSLRETWHFLRKLPFKAPRKPFKRLDSMSGLQCANHQQQCFSPQKEPTQKILTCFFGKEREA